MPIINNQIGKKAIKEEKTLWKFEYNCGSGKSCKYDLMSFLAQHNAAYWEHDKI